MKIIKVNYKGTIKYFTKSRVKTLMKVKKAKKEDLLLDWFMKNFDETWLDLYGDDSYTGDLISELTIK